MNTISTLVKMQLNEKLNKRNKSGNSVIRILGQVLFTILKFAFATTACWLLFLFAKLYTVFASSVVPNTFIAFLFCIMFSISAFSCTIRITKAIYFSKDNVILLTLPCTPTQVFLSKLIVFFIYELKKSLMFFIPIFLGYFIAHGHPVLFYPWVFICFIFISILTVALGAFLSIPAMWIANIFRQRKILQAIIIILGFSLAVLALFFIISSIPQELDLRKGWKEFRVALLDFFNAFAESSPIFHNLTCMLTGEIIYTDFSIIFDFPVGTTLLRFATLLASSIALILLSIAIVNPLFYSMASKPFEYLKAKVKPKRNKARKSSLAALHVEILKTLKDSSKLAYNVGLMVATPVLIFILNTVFAAMPTDEFGNKLIIASNILIILLISLNANSYAASVFSRDGRSAYLIKVQPKNPTSLLMAKLIPTTIFCTISFTLTAVSMIFFSGFEVIDTLSLIAGAFCIYISHLFYSAELDIIHPHTEIYAAVGEYENDPNELKSSSMAFTLSFAISALMLLLLFKESISAVCIKFALVALLALVYRSFLFFTNIKLYYKET